LEEAESGGVLNEMIPDAKYKKLRKRSMKQDPETGEWVLRYRAQN
jgi:hypothetical protein